MTPKIEWPEHWDSSKGWPTCRDRLTDGRLWGAADDWLFRNRRQKLIGFLDCLGRSLAWAPEEVVRSVIQGLSIEEFKKTRPTLHLRIPDPSTFPKAYGKTYLEVRDGGRRDWVALGTLQSLIQQNAWTKERYTEVRASLGVNFPGADSFPKIYGRTFAQVRDGHRGDEFAWVAAEEVRARIQGMPSAEYDAVRESWGKGFPSSQLFRKAYGKRFAEFRDGMPFRNRPWVSEEKVRLASRGLTREEYDARCRTLGRDYPNGGQFPFIYGKTFSELRGTLEATWLSESALRRRIRSMTARQYANQAAEVGGPPLAKLEAVYGKTFAELRGGRRDSKLKRT